MYPAHTLTIILCVCISSVWYSVICQLDAYHLLLAFLFCLWLTLISTTNWDFVPNLSHIMLSHFYLQMLNDVNVKNSWDNLRWKYQLKQIMKTREKNNATSENCIPRKMSSKFQNPSFNILCKIAFWNKQKWLNKELIGGTALKNDKFHLQENSDRMELRQPEFTIPSQLSKHACPLS